MSAPRTDRLLVIDDQPEIHRDFDKILAPPDRPDDHALDQLESLMLSAARPTGEQAHRVELVHAHQGQEGYDRYVQARAQGRPFFAVFVDMRMPPGWDGLRTIKALRAADPDVMVVLCTAHSDYSWDHISREVGGLDKLMILKKPFEPVELQAMTRSLAERAKLLEQSRLRTEELERLVALRTQELQRERDKDKLMLEHLEAAVAERTAELRDLAHSDALTGLPNRACFYERLLSAVRRSRCEAGYQYAVLYLDFDRFKIINDSLGHGMGDRLLRMIGGRLTEAMGSAYQPALGDEPMPARLGGDEFCILLEGFTDRDAVQAFADGVLARLSEPYMLEGRSVASGLSMGIAFQHADYQHAEDVLRDADLAMYAAKTAGRGRVVVFTPHMHEQAMRRMVIEQDLRDAAERGHLTLFLQPTVSLQTREVLGAEALLRWRHPQRGMIGPGDFIPMAEETGIIHALGLWVFEETCRLLKRLPTLGYLGFNVSPLQLTQDDFLPGLERLLDVHQPDPRRLVCEVTESVLTECPDTALYAIDWMHQRGIRVFLDDFGSGVSSLGTLRRFPLDGIKLDRSFLDQNVFERRTAAVIQSAIHLAHDLGIELIAEGVEVVEQAALLQALHCDAAQGYLFAQPLPVEEFLRMLAQEQQRAVA